MIYLWDTNTAIYYLNRISAIRKKAAQVEVEKIFICEIVRGELIFGALRSKWKTENLNNLDKFFFNIKTLFLTSECGKNYAHIKQNLFKKGRPITGTEARSDDNDLWIASIALTHNATLVSNDAGFQYIDGLKWENWLK